MRREKEDVAHAVRLETDVVPLRRESAVRACSRGRGLHPGKNVDDAARRAHTTATWGGPVVVHLPCVDELGVRRNEAFGDVAVCCVVLREVLYLLSKTDIRFRTSGSHTLQHGRGNAWSTSRPLKRSGLRERVRVRHGCGVGFGRERSPATRQHEPTPIPRPVIRSAR